MNKVLLLSIVSLLTGCFGESFVATGGGETNSTGGSGGETASTGGTGGSSSSNSSTSSTSSTTFTTSTSSMMLTFSNIPVTVCETNYVFVPWSGYNPNLVNAPAVSCMSVPKGQDFLVVKDFTYNLFKGEAKLVSTTCDISDHPAVWFVSSLDANGQVAIPNNVVLNEIPVLASQLVWTDFITPNFIGSVAPVTVTMNDMVTISGNELFCFGHRFTLSPEGNSTCLASCLDDVDYTKHQISDSKEVPYNFNPGSSWPPGDGETQYSFIASVTGGTIPSN